MPCCKTLSSVSLSDIMSRALQMLSAFLSNRERCIVCGAFSRDIITLGHVGFRRKFFGGAKL